MFPVCQTITYISALLLWWTRLEAETFFVFHSAQINFSISVLISTLFWTENANTTNNCGDRPDRSDAQKFRKKPQAQTGSLQVSAESFEKPVCQHFLHLSLWFWKPGDKLLIQDTAFSSEVSPTLVCGYGGVAGLPAHVGNPGETTILVSVGIKENLQGQFNHWMKMVDIEEVIYPVKEHFFFWLAISFQL